MHQEIDPTRAEPPLPISIANILNFKYDISSNSVIPAPAYARTGTPTVQTSYPDTASLTKGRLKTPKYAFQTTSPISPEPVREKC
ncbi:hypothetical protein [Neisseria sp. HMSC064E01]|uniref:hypothetical protein n=1 Tax=Neisseria sp. HMSC064E01 TaxID=1715052 RepID=UPI0009F37D92|nr:hypothetical protein [Neisseria sp. HMSC064E01]